MSVRVQGAPAPAVAAPKVAPKTCGEVKELYRTNKCCGHPAQAIAVAPACPYNFNKPQCSMAEPQAPRDLSTGAAGLKTPKAATLTEAQSKLLPQANVHFHLGAEHKSDNYKDDTDSKAYDAKNGGRRLAAVVRPGWMCAAPAAGELQAYTFQHCKGQVSVGKSYEIHYVHSSAGYDADHIKNVADIDLMNDGLGGAANGRGMLNPMVVVQAQVFQIVSDGTDSPKIADMIHGWQPAANNDNRVMYPGSTTGPSHTNTICSPYAITWHVDKACHKVSAASFDNMCKMMAATYKMESDLYPHGSRILVDSKWVVKPEYVTKLA